MKVKSEREVVQSCLTLRDPTDFSLPGSSVHGIFQARVLEWGAIEATWFQNPDLPPLDHMPLGKLLNLLCVSFLIYKMGLVRIR